MTNARHSTGSLLPAAERRTPPDQSPDLAGGIFTLDVSDCSSVSTRAAVGDGSPPPEIATTTTSQKVLACRLSVHSVDWLMAQDTQWYKHAGWTGVTHVLYESLYIDADNCVTMHKPSTHTDNVLDKPSTYLPIVKMLGKPIVYSMPDYGDPETLVARLRRFEGGVDTILPSLLFVVEKYGIELLELDAEFLRIVFEYYAMNGLVSVFEAKLRVLGPRLWISFNSERPLWSALHEFQAKTLYKLVHELTDVVVLKSYGFIRFNRLKTSHGTFQTMTVHPESALRHFIQRFEMLKNDWSPGMIVMEMDTCGVEYLLNPTHGGVSGFRSMPLHEISRQKLFGGLNYEDEYDAQNQCSLLKFHDERRVISYDNSSVRAAKVEYVQHQGMLGFVVGEPQHDLTFGHTDSLLAMLRAALLE